MHAAARLVAALSWAALCALPAAADTAPAAPELPAAEREGPRSPVTAAAQRAEPRVDRRVIEDEHVRIEELRVRGQLQRVTVQSKLRGAREYEIIVGPGGRDPSQDRGNAGRSAWRVLGF